MVMHYPDVIKKMDTERLKRLKRSIEDELRRREKKEQGYGFELELGKLLKIAAFDDDVKEISLSHTYVERCWRYASMTLGDLLDKHGDDLWDEDGDLLDMDTVWDALNQLDHEYDSFDEESGSEVVETDMYYARNKGVTDEALKEMGIGEKINGTYKRY